jgi:hypothetical protein
VSIWAPTVTKDCSRLIGIAIASSLVGSETQSIATTTLGLADGLTVSD